MLSSHARRRVRRFQVTSHLLAGLALVAIALRHETAGGTLPWTAGIAAVLLLGLVGWEQLQPTGQPLSMEITAELLGIAVLVAAAVPVLRQGPRVLPLIELLLALALAAALFLHRGSHRSGHVAHKGATG
jgi:hypothetical protein